MPTFWFVRTRAIQRTGSAIKVWFGLKELSHQQLLPSSELCRSGHFLLRKRTLSSFLLLLSAGIQQTRLDRRFSWVGNWVWSRDGVAKLEIVLVAQGGATVELQLWGSMSMGWSSRSDGYSMGTTERKPTNLRSCIESDGWEWAMSRLQIHMLSPKFD